MAATDAERSELAGDGAVPVYGTPEEAARALGHVARYAAWRRAGPDEPPSLPDVDADAVAAVLATRARRDGGGWLAPGDVEAVLARLRHPARRVAARGQRRPRRAARAELGGPVALKAVAPGLVHKADAGAVALGVERHGGAARARRARWLRAVRAAGHEPRASSCSGWRRPASSCSWASSATPTSGRSWRAAPAGTPSSCSATSRCGSLRSARATPRRWCARCARSRCSTATAARRPADVAAVEDVLLRVSALAAAHPEIAELDCNPLHVGPDGAVVSTRASASPRRRAPRPYPSLDR